MQIKNPFPRIGHLLYQFILAWQKPLFAAVMTGIIFFIITMIYKDLWRLSIFGYFNYLADAFLHGQLYLREIPVSTKDLSYYQGQYYLYWGPLPAVLLMPFVAIFGVGFSDHLQTIFIGSLNVGVFALLLQRMQERSFLNLDPFKKALLVIFFAMGTAQAPLLPMGTVWRLAQLLTLTFALLAYLAAFSYKDEKAFWWTGCAMAGVLATRLSGVFVAIFLAWYLLQQHKDLGFRRLIKNCIVGVVPVIIVGLLLLLYNQARFGNPFDNGLNYHQMSDTFREMFTQYGLMNVHYIPANLYLNFLFYPILFSPSISLAPMGGSLFLLSPLFFGAISSLWTNRYQWSTWFLWVSILIGSIPSFMIMAPGSIGLGPRYLLDIAPPLLLVTATGIQKWSNRSVAILSSLSVFQYLMAIVMMLPNWN